MTSLSKDDVCALFEDRSGLLWIGTWNGGLSVLDPYAQAFRTLQRRARDPDSLPDDDVISLAEAPDGRLWLGSRNGVLAVGDPAADRFRPVAPLLAARGRLTAIAFAGGEVLVGTRQGLVPLDREARELPLPPSWRALGLGEQPVTALATGLRGEVWLLTEVGLFRLRTGPGGEREALPVSLPLQGPPSALHLTETGRLWVGSETGELATASDGGELRRVEASDLEDRLIVTMLEDAAGRLWIGTRRGLARLEPASGTVVWFTEAHGLPSEAIAGLLAGADGRLWVATNRGLTRLDPRSGAMTHFGTREGAKGSGYADGAFARGRELLYFAGQGVTVFDPRAVRVNPTPPRIVFTALELEHQPIEPRWQNASSPLLEDIHAAREITLPPGLGVFSVEMSALHFADPKSVRYAYRLDGFDPEWVETDAAHRWATYTHLPAGDYLLRVLARTRGGLATSDEATLAVHVLPPWWRTVPALAGWIAMALLLMAGALAEMQRRTRVRVERETLRRVSVTDVLTGLTNRRFLTTYLEHEVPRTLRAYEDGGAAAEGADILFIVVDVDRFKPINDRHGHAVGDRVLMSVARALRDEIRESDLAVRWGGDEFVIVSRSFDRQHAGATAERLRRAVSLLDVGLPEGLTISVGLAPFPFLTGAPRAMNWEQTLDLADRALLLTKRAGRNSCTGLQATPDLPPPTVLEYLAWGSEALVPDGIEVVTPEAPRPLKQVLP